MAKVRIELEKFINVKGKTIFFGEKKPLSAVHSEQVGEIFQLMVQNDKRLMILTEKDEFQVKGIVATSDLCHFLLRGETCDFCTQFPSHYQMIYEQPISEIMTTAVVKVHEDVPLFITVQIMVEQNKGTLPIIDHDGDLVGIITERDLAFLLADTEHNIEVKVREIMTPNVITCHANCTIGNALHIICREGFRRLPVLENDQLIGYLTVKNLLKYFIRENVVKLFKTHDIKPAFEENVSAIMSRPVITIGPNAPVTECAKILKQKNIGALPVVEDQKLIGIITEHDFVEAMAFKPT